MNNVDNITFDNKYDRSSKSFFDNCSIFNLDKVSRNKKISFIQFVSSLFVCVFGIVFIYQILIYEPITTVGITFTGAFKFVIICLGLSWLLHGTGFVLVRYR